MKKKIKEQKQLYTTVALIFNAWFGRSLSELITELALGLYDKRLGTLLENIFLSEEDHEKFIAYEKALRDFKNYGYNAERIANYESAWEYCGDFFIDPEHCLAEVLAVAPRVQKNGLLARIRMKEHRIESLEEFEKQFKGKLLECGKTEEDLNSFIGDSSDNTEEK